MELDVLILRVHCMCICLCEIFLISAAEGIKGADKFPVKLNYNFRPEKKPVGRESRADVSEMRFGTSNFSWDKDSIEQSKILDFIDTIRTNQSARDVLCNKSRNLQIITLGDFNYKFQPSSFQKYKEQVEKLRFIARYLTNLFSSNNGIRLTSFNDGHVSDIISVLKTIVEEDMHIAGIGVAFETFFPYVYKNSTRQTSIKDFGLVYKNFTQQEFYLVHTKIRSNPNDVSVHWGTPYYDCFHFKHWVAGVSYPFYDNATNRELK